MLASTVSSKMLARVAEFEDFKFEDRLTGFKWLGNGALELEKLGYVVPFAYEEAIGKFYMFHAVGFMMGGLAPDKDGISAMARFGELVVQLKTQDKSVAQHLEELYQRYRVYISNSQIWLFCHGKFLFYLP